MTEQKIREWSGRVPVALALMTQSPERLLGVMRLVAMARALNPELPKGEIADLALTVLAWELVSHSMAEEAAAAERKAA